MTDTGMGLEVFPTAVAEASGGMRGLTQAERRAKGQEARRRRLSELKGKLPKRSMDLVDGVPNQYQGRLVKVLVKEGSRQEAIRAHCEQCVGWEDVRPRVGGCTTFACALHAYRPYQAAEGLRQAGKVDL